MRLKAFKSGINRIVSPVVRQNIINSFYYFGGSFVGLLLGVFTQPIFSRHLEPYDFAVIGYFASIQAFFYPLFSLNFITYYLSRYWDPGETTGKDLSFHINFLNIANSIVACLAIVLILAYFKLAKVSFPVYPFALLIIGNLLFEKYKAYFLVYCRVNKFGLKYFSFTVLQVLMTAGFALYFVVCLDGGAVGRMSGQTLTIIFLGVLSIILFKRRGLYKATLKINLSEVKKAFKFCTPLLLGSYLYYPVSNIDKIFLERIGNTQEFGYYNLGLTIASYVGTFFVTLYMAFEPDFYKYTTQRRAKAYRNLLILYVIIITVVALIAITFSGYVVAYLTSNRYLESTKYVNIMIIAMYLYSIGDVFQQLFYSLNATKLSLIRNLLMAIAGISVYYFFVKHSQFIGAAWARVVLYILYIIFGVILFYSKFRFNIHRIIKNQ